MPASLFDTNVWIAAVFSTHPYHSNARQILRDATTASPVLFCRSTHQSFLRLASTPALVKIYGADAMTNRDAVITLEALLAVPQVRECEEPPGMVALWHRLASVPSASPKIWMDAYLAAFAITGRLQFVTLDRDFVRYEPHGLDLQLLRAVELKS